MVSVARKGKVFPMKLKLEGNRLKKDIKKENFEKDVVLLIETNQQINRTFEHSASSNTSFKKHLNAKSFKMFWEYWCKLSFRRKLKKPSSSTVSAETPFDDECNKEALNTCNVFPAIIENITWNSNSRILVMLFFGFPISPYPIQSHATSIGYTEAYVKTSESDLSSCYIHIIKP